ncbi:hypothetical protein ABH926_007104 [Catenulispora sp. GP43]|uniref:HEAT repeat domain-containing protein n=1 Tax=Catenulispora sp. GP43 TaxID=3156263 RepID=UPI0035164EE7
MEPGDAVPRQQVSAGRDAFTAVHQTITIVNAKEAQATGRDPSPLRVYISSTFEDLPEHRAQVRLAMQRLDVTDVVMGTYVAEESRPLDRCLADVRSSDLYIGLLAWRYGYIPDGHDKSITELEYDQAGEADVPRLMFLHDETAPWPPVWVDRGAAYDKIETFRQRVAERHVCDFFTTADDLRSKVAEAVSREIQRRMNGVPDQRITVAGRAEWARYRGRLVDEYRRLDLDALTPPERDEHLAIGLREVFVEPNVREDVSPPELPKALQVRIQESARISADDLPQGVDRQRLEQVQQSYRARPAELAFDAVGQPRARLVVLLGDPGAGKSTLSRYIALSLAQEQEHERLAALRGYQPVLVELRDYSLSRDRHETLIEYLSFRARSDGLGVPAEVLEDELHGGGKILVLLDGLDELFDPREREAVARQIAGFAATYPSARILVTSRVVGYRPRILREAGFRHYTIQDLDPKQTDTFLESWYGLALGDRPAVAAGRRERLVRSIRESPSIRELAGNPMLLTILAIIGKHQELPRERWKVYDHAASVLIQHWDVNKHLQDASVDAAVIREDDKKELLRRLAYRMQTGAQGLAGNHLWHDDLVAEIRDYLQTRFQYEPTRAAAIANAMIEQFRERNFVLARYGSRIYGFVHRGLLEFFCASEIVARFEKTRELSESDLVTDVFGGHWEDHAWSEVLRLVTGMVDVSVADRIIAHLVTEARPAHSGMLDNPSLEAVTLATQCLVEIRNISAATNSALQTLEALIATLRRPIRSFAEARDQRLVTAVLPAITAIGARWPGRERYLAWFDEYGGRTGVRPAAQFAARFVAALFPDSDRVRDELADRAITAPDSDQRGAAVLGLSAVWPDRDATREVVLCAVRDPIINVRSAAFDAISEHWADHPDALAALSVAVRDYSDGVRKSALVALSTHWTAEPVAFTAVCQALVDHDSEVRKAALSALVTRWGQHADTLPTVRNMARHDPHWDVRRAALEFLAASWADDPETLPLVRRASEEVDEDVREAALNALVAQWAEDPNTLLAVHRAFGDLHEGVRATAVDLLATRWLEHPKTPDLLEQAGRDIDGAVRFMARVALARLSGVPEDPVAVLRQAAEDPDSGMRTEALESFGENWSEEPGSVEAVWRATRDPSRGVRRKALAFLLDHWPRHRLTRRAALAAVGDPDADARTTAMRILAMFHAADPDVRPVFVAATRSRDGIVRQVALETLAASQADDVGAHLLRHATEDPDPTIRQFALESLIADPRWASECAAAVEIACMDPDGGVRGVTHQTTIADRFGPKASQAELLIAARSAVALDREAALFQLVARDPSDPVVWEEVRRAAADMDAEVRRMAFDLAVMWQPDTDIGRAIAGAAARDSVSGIRYSAIKALSLSAAGCVPDSDLLGRALIDLDDAIRQFGVVTVLLRKPDAVETTVWLARASSDANFHIRLFAQQSLAEHFRDDTYGFRALKRAARASSSAARAAALETLVTCWPQDPDTLAAVCEAAQDPESTVRLVAIASLALRWPQHAEAIALIDYALRDADFQVAGFARHALVMLGHIDRIVTIADATRLTRDTCLPARVAGLEFLLIRWPDAAQTREAVQRALTDQLWPMHGIALDATCLSAADDEGVALAIAAWAVGRPEAVARGNGTQILEHVGLHRNDSRERITNLLHEPVGYIRRAGFEILLAAWPEESETREVARRSARDLDDDVRLAALQHLVRHRFRDATASREAWAALRYATLDPNEAIRRFAVETLTAFQPNELGTRVVQVAARRDPQRSVRVLRLDSVQSPPPLYHFDDLVRAASSSDWTQRWDAIDQLSVRWPDHPMVLELLVTAAVDPHFAQRELVLSALTRIRRDDANIRRMLFDAVRDPSAVVRMTALDLLMDCCPDAAETRDAILALCGDSDELVRGQACAVYAWRWLSGIARLRKVLTDSLRDSHWWVRYQAVKTATLLREVSPDDLLGAAADGAPITRYFLEFSLARWVSGLPLDLPSLLGLYSSADQALAVKAGYVLATSWGDRDEVLPVLYREAVGGNCSTAIKSVIALVGRQGPGEETRDLLARAVTSDFSGLRRAAIETLALPAFGDITEVVNRIIADDDVAVRQPAREWLQKRYCSSPLLADLSAAAVPSADRVLEQLAAVKELVLWRRDDHTFPALVQQVARNVCLTEHSSEWLRWFCEQST